MAPPRRAQLVTVHLPDGPASLAARVDEADDESLTLILTAPPARPGELRDRSAVVEFTTPRGVHRVTGALDQGDSPEVLRIRRESRDDVVQRRDFARIDAAVPIDVTVTGPVRGAAHTSSVDISGGGLSFSDPLGLSSGASVDVRIELSPGSAPVCARGRVVRDMGEGAAGVQIEEIASSDRERLVRFVAERERLARRIAREA